MRAYLLEIVKSHSLDKEAGIKRLIAPILAGAGALVGGKHLLSYLGKKKTGDKDFSMERDFDYKFKNKPWLGYLDKDTETVYHNPGDWTALRAYRNLWTPEELAAQKDEGMWRYNHIWGKRDVLGPGGKIPRATFGDDNVTDEDYQNRIDEYKRKMEPITKATEKQIARRS